MVPVIDVHTLRMGKPWWMEPCGKTLDAWCERHGHRLRVWRARDIPKGYPHPKFCEIDMLKEFLAGPGDWFFYVDADVYVAEDAPRSPEIPQGGLLAMRDAPSKTARNWPRWSKVRYPQHAIHYRTWHYRNAGIWMCDRVGAEMILKQARKPHWVGCMDQNAWNTWCAAAHAAGMPVHDMPETWNAFNYWKEEAHFYHLAGKNKWKKWQQRVERGHFPQDSEDELTEKNDDE